MLRFVILLSLLLVQAFIASAQVSSKTKPDQFLQASGFALKNLKGQTVKLSDYKGKVVIINFWAPWCVPCRAEIPQLVLLQKEYKKQGLQIIGITYPPTNRALLRRTVKTLKFNYPVLLGTRKLAALYNVTDVLPVSVIVDRKGKVQDYIKGIIEAEEIEKLVPLISPKSKVQSPKLISILNFEFGIWNQA